MAVEVSTKQMALVRDSAAGGFMERLQAMLTVVARTVLSESGGTAHHQGRAVYAQRVLASPVQAAQVAAPVVVMGVNLTSTTTYDEPTKKATCTATDAQLESQITTFWNSLAGLDTPGQ